MNQHVRSGGTFVETWWPFEADQALQTFEAEFDAPPQTVEVEDIFGREIVGREGGQQNEPVGGLEGSYGNLITFPLSIPSGLAPCLCGGLFGLADGDQTQRKVGAVLAFDKDRPIDAATFGRPQHGEEIDRLAIFVAPARPFPFAAYQHVGASLKYTGNAVRLQIGPVAKADLAFDDRNAIKRLPFLFVCQLKVTETLTGQVEGAVNAPKVALLLGCLPRFGNAGSIDDADQAAPAGLRSRREPHLVNQKTQPVAALSQAIEQRWRRYVHQPHRRGPGRRQSEPVIAKTIGEEQAQQDHRVFYHASLPKSAGLPCAALKKRRATKPFYEIFPVLIQKRFVSHPTLNHKSIPTSKNILTPMRSRGERVGSARVKLPRFVRKLATNLSSRERSMTQPSFLTHEVFNQSPPFEDVDLFTLDRPLVEAVAANGGASAQEELSEFGRHWGSAAMAARGRAANENTPKLRTFDSRGVRHDEVEFHPAYHELMARSAHAGIHNSTWTADGKPAGGAAEVVRAAKFYMAAQVETGHLCPITMTRASVAALAAQPDLLAKTMPVIGTRAYDPTFAPWPEKRGMTLGDRK